MPGEKEKCQAHERKVPGARMGRDWIWILGANVVREAVCLGFAGESRERWAGQRNLAGRARRNVRAR